MKTLIIFLSLGTALYALADTPGAHMTPERQKRIEQTIKKQHAILPVSKKTAPPGPELPGQTIPASSLKHKKQTSADKR